MAENNTRKRFAPHCALPWQQMIIDANGNVGCCGGLGNTRSLGNLREKSILDIWNGKDYQDLRQKLARGDMEGAGCGSCAAKKWDVFPDLALAPEPVGGYIDCDYKRNVEILKQEYTDGKVLLHAKPSIISYSGTYDCNYNCIMCYQYHTKNRAKFRQERLPGKVYREMFDLCRYYSQLIWGGGEPFYQKECLNFIKGFDKSLNPYLGFFVTTNGSLLTKEIINHLKSFYNVFLNFSIDAGSKEIYEKIRQNGKWEVVMNNLKMAADVRDERPNWQVGWNFTVMKKNIFEMRKAMSLVIEMGIPITFNPVIDHPMSLRLDVYSNYFSETSGWDNEFETVYQMADWFQSNGIPGRRSNCTSQIKYIWDIVKSTRPTENEVDLSGKLQGLEKQMCLTFEDCCLCFFDNKLHKYKGYAMLEKNGSFTLKIKPGNYRFDLIVNRFDKFPPIYSLSNVNVSFENNFTGLMVRNDYPTAIYYCLDYAKTSFLRCSIFRGIDSTLDKFGNLGQDWLRRNSMKIFQSNQCIPQYLNLTLQLF
ncbi:MAG: molybdenum cofactor biosynthesis protein A [Pelotomaculum sp. PtaU1.Bin065]|nr:MAG: molybdenum cofactor biosynthesis protein A [Pelotomaculum sp. PtaU1.Bin065]